MKRGPLVVALAAVVSLDGGGAVARGDDVLPQPSAAARYAKMADRSPFAPPSIAPPTVASTPPPAGPKWSDDLMVALLTQQGGVYFVTIEDKTKHERFLVQSNKEDTERHLEVASVQWGDLVDQTTVTLRHNNEFAAVRFDASAAAAAPAANPAALPRRVPVPGTYPASAGTPAPGRLQPPPNPPRAPNVRRPSVIRAAPPEGAPPLQPPAGLSRRPLTSREDDDK